MPKAKSQLLELIEWEDSARGNGWEFVSDMSADTVKIKSVGYLLNETKTSVLLVPHISDAHIQGCGQMVIPKRAIISRKRL